MLRVLSRCLDMATTGAAIFCIVVLIAPVVCVNLEVLMRYFLGKPTSR